MGKVPAKSNKAVIVDAIVKQLERGKDFAAVLALIGTKWHFSRRTFVRYWKIANEQHTAAQQALKEAKAALDLENALKERQNDIADVLERQEILTKIARGQIPLRKHVIVDRVIEYIDVVPDYMDRKAAIAELNKMDGAYAPLKIAQTGKNGEDLPVPAPQIIILPAGGPDLLEIKEGE